MGNRTRRAVWWNGTATAKKYDRSNKRLSQVLRGTVRRHGDNKDGLQKYKLYSLYESHEGTMQGTRWLLATVIAVERQRVGENSRNRLLHGRSWFNKRISLPVRKLCMFEHIDEGNLELHIMMIIEFFSQKCQINKVYN